MVRRVLYDNEVLPTHSLNIKQYYKLRLFSRGSGGILFMEVGTHSSTTHPEI